MKCIFSFNDVNYISPSKKAARAFLRHFQEKGEIRRLETTWRLKHIERAPSYGQIRSLDLRHIEYSKK